MHVGRESAHEFCRGTENTEAQHRLWWQKYWAKSYVEIGNPIIEKQYYVSNYVLGSCSRDMEFPPGIFGWTTTDTPGWNGDYHLNYNHMAPFYALYSCNHIEQADPHDTPLLDFMERSKWHAKLCFNSRGVYYPVGIGPRGIETTFSPSSNRGMFFGQRSNSAYGLVNVAQRWYLTYDLNYAKKLYPYVLEVANFWEDYLRWEKEGNRYVIDNDSVHEKSGNDFNSIVSLALVRNA